MALFNNNNNNNHLLHSKKPRAITPSQEPNPSGEDPHQEPKIPVLNPDIMLEIFSYLSKRDLGRAASVCQQWQTYAYSKQLWRNVVFSWKSNYDEAVVQSLVTRGIQRIRITSDNSDVSDPPNVLTFLQENCIFSALKELHIEGMSQLPSETFVKLGFHFPNIEILSYQYNTNYVECWKESSQNIGKQAFTTIFSQWERLKELTVNGIVRGEWFSGQCKPLVLERMTLATIYNFTNDTIKVLVDCFPNLRYLRLQMPSGIMKNHYGDACLEHLRKLTKVEKVIFGGCPCYHVTREAIEKYRSETGVDLVMFPGMD